MTNNEKKFPVPRKIRNTAKQSILISGQPDFLYRYKEVKETFIIFDGKKKSIGNISDDIHLTLFDLAKGTDVKIIRETKLKKSPATSIEGFTSISIQKHKKDTMLVVPSSDEASLMKKVSELKSLLESKGAITQERCNWVCVVDKGKTQVSDEQILKAESVIKIKSSEISNQQLNVGLTSALIDHTVSYPVYTNTPIKSMSEKTKSLHDIALKTIKEAKS